MRYLRLVVLAIAVFVGAGVAGYGRVLTSSALVVAAATLALGVAGQSVIGPLIGGLVLVFDPAFNVGNHIEWETGEGVIRSITLRVTRVETPNGELVTVPNTVLTSRAIRRPYGGQRYRVVGQVGLSYADDLDEAVRHLESVAMELDAVLAVPPPRALVSDLGGDEVVADVHYWVADPQEGEVQAVRSSYVRARRRASKAKELPSVRRRSGSCRGASRSTDGRSRSLRRREPAAHRTESAMNGGRRGLPGRSRTGSPACLLHPATSRATAVRGPAAHFRA